MLEEITFILKNDMLTSALSSSLIYSMALSGYLYNGDYKKPIRAAAVIVGIALPLILLFVGNDFSIPYSGRICIYEVFLCCVLSLFGFFLGVHAYNKHYYKYCKKHVTSNTQVTTDISKEVREEIKQGKIPSGTLYR